MNHTALRTFHAVATEGSFTRAAASLRLTQPTLSAQVKAIEEEYGTVLFVRRGRGVALTKVGAALLEITRRIFTLEVQAGELLAQARELTVGQLRLGADSPYHVMPFLAGFAQRYPRIELTLSLANGQEVLEALLGQRIDVAVLADPADDARLEAISCGRHSLVALVPKAHGWARRKAVPLKELAANPVVLREKGSRTRQIFEDALARADAGLGRVVEIESREGVREAVAGGLGIGIVSAAEVGHDSRLASVRLTGEGLETGEYVVCLTERRNLRMVDAFLEIVRRDEKRERNPVRGGRASVS